LQPSAFAFALSAPRRILAQSEQGLLPGFARALAVSTTAPGAK